MGLFSKLFGYRWSLYVARNQRELAYAMHCHSVIRMVGYIAGYYSKGMQPRAPWSIHLNYNRTHDAFELLPQHFTSVEPQITTELINEIARIDPGWQVRGSEPVFMDARTKKEIEIYRPLDIGDVQGMIDRLGDPKPPTFFSIMDDIFESASDQVARPNPPDEPDNRIVFSDWDDD